jgi:ubiquinone/menaquinone biosynthesis C-methylase UbiE
MGRLLLLNALVAVLGVLVVYSVTGDRDLFGARRYIARRVLSPRADAFSRHVLPLYTSWLLAHSHAEYAAQIGAELDDTVLEVGCGFGEGIAAHFDAADAAARSLGMPDQVGRTRALGVDVSPTAVAVAEERLRARFGAERVNVTVGDASSLLYPSNMFDIVTSMNLVGQWGPEKRREVIKEMFRVTGVSGLLAVCVRPADTWDSAFLSGFGTVPFHPNALKEDLAVLEPEQQTVLAEADDYICALKMKTAPTFTEHEVAQQELQAAKDKENEEKEAAAATADGDQPSIQSVNIGNPTAA